MNWKKNSVDCSLNDEGISLNPFMTAAIAPQINGLVSI